MHGLITQIDSKVEGIIKRRLSHDQNCAGGEEHSIGSPIGHETKVISI